MVPFPSSSSLSHDTYNSEFVRNEALLLLIQLTKSNPNVQKVWFVGTQSSLAVYFFGCLLAANFHSRART